ncbi:hypothetical protein UlMin_022457 [Ulmus minor]
MTKKPQRRTVRYEKDQSGCMSGLISMLDFRHGRSTRKLLADKRHGKNAFATGFSKNKFDVLSNLDDNGQGTDGEENIAATLTADAGKPSVKKLIEEEMFSEQGTKEITNVVEEAKVPESVREGQMKTNHKRVKKTRKKSRDMDANNLNVAESIQSKCPCDQDEDQQSVKDLDIDEIIEEFSRQVRQKTISCLKHDRNGDPPVLLSHKHSDFEEKLNGAIKEFISQKITDGKHLKEEQKIRHSRELMESLELMTLDEELFLKVLQDPNSLLVKYVQNVQEAQGEQDEESKSVPGSEFSEQKLVNLRKPEDLVNHKQRSFFRRKSKSQERIQLKTDEHPNTLNRIVILKPGPTSLRSSNAESGIGSSPESHSIVRSKGPSDRVGSNFFLAELKRKLKHAMGKQQHEISRGTSNKLPFNRQNMGDNDKGVGKGTVGRNSPTKDHFFMEKIAKPSSASKRSDKISKMKDSEIGKHEVDGFPNQRISNIYVEAKKHLSEMLSNGDEIVGLSDRHNPNSLGKILSLPEYSISPIGSPRRDWENSFVTAQMRFSGKDKCQEVNDNSRLSPMQENNVSPLSRESRNVESQSPISDNSPDGKVQALNSNSSADIIHDIEVEETVCTTKDDTSHEGDLEIVKEESIILDSSSEPSGSSTRRDDQNGDIPVVSDDKEYLECLKEDSHEENRVTSSLLGSPPSSLTTNKVADPASVFDIPERPSPVSVLEPLFSEDDISPTNDTSQSDEASNGKRYAEDKEAVFDFVEAVMEASSMNWDEFCMKGLSSDQLLDPSLVDEVVLYPNQLCCDQELLFACINEVLREVCEQYSGYSPWVAFAKPTMRPIPSMKHAILEVSKGVHWHLLELPLPRTLEQIIRKDMARTGSWLDTQFDTEAIGFDMGDSILDDLMEDFILSYLDDSSENAHEVLPELQEIKVNTNL